jgi:ubiquinone/menaquinone biosynthesis C-methylase UbiE
MVDLAIGTQTAGSVIRPASFCGVIALKPTFGLLPTAGMKVIAPSLDTVGLFAKDFDVLETAFKVLAAGDETAEGVDPTFVFVPSDVWDGADDDCKTVVQCAAARVNARHRDLPEGLVGLAAELTVVQAYEAARSLAWERSTHPDLLSQQLCAILAWGDQITTDQYRAAQQWTHRARTPESMDALFGPHDVIITPAAVGEAPDGLSSTGDPRFNRLWTLLGCPALNLPGPFGGSGLPIGIQLVARPYHEAVLIHAGRRLAATLREPASRSLCETSGAFARVAALAGFEPHLRRSLSDGASASTVGMVSGFVNHFDGIAGFYARFRPGYPRAV